MYMLGELENVIEVLASNNNELRQIIFLTLKMSFFSTVISSIVGVSGSIFLTAITVKNIKKYCIRIINTLMGIPPVVGGLVVFLLFSRSGPFGQLRWMYSLNVMVIAQVLLITPVVIGLSAPVLEKKQSEISETIYGLRISRGKKVFLLLYECKNQLIGIVMAAFGRSIAEVGAVQLVGGNVQYKTRVMTTAIMLETNRGNFKFAISLGIVLLICSFMVNVFASVITDNLDNKV